MSGADHSFAAEAGTTADGTLRVELAGDLAWDSTDDLLDAVRTRLDRAPAPSDIRLDCARLTLCDSMGLSALLALHRLASAAGGRLHLDRRPAFLDRLLLLTGTYEHLTGRPGTAEPTGEVPAGRADGRGSRSS
ncbi:STAS domain-containing protein [Streptomyces sp. NPDC014656]|uniref:STAS domain-containing protein n=1 Tax=Streptomyces sp. NPDC014656 TaxID=3364878 RepID=UPI003700ADCC